MGANKKKWKSSFIFYKISQYVKKMQKKVKIALKKKRRTKKKKGGGNGREKKRPFFFKGVLKKKKGFPLFLDIEFLAPFFLYSLPKAEFTDGMG